MPVPDTFLSLAVALGLGLLVGLQRERADPDIAGLRTFSLAAIFGGLAMLVGVPIVAVGLVSLAALVIVGNVIKLRAGELEPGLTTEVAILVVYLVGALAVAAPRAIAIAVGATVAVLLHFKQELHGFVHRIAERDFKAFIQFVLLALVVLPVLPNRTFGPYGVLNPREIWFMVVLIVGLGMAGYVGYKRFGERAGSVLAGVLGGLVSSTATTVSYARRSKSHEGGDHAAARVILIATVVVYVRVLIEIGAVAPGFLRVAAPPLVILAAVLALMAWVVSRRSAPRADDAEMPDPGNPSELRSALLFGALYGAVLVAVAWAQDAVGDRGVYLVAVLSGLTDMDAITLSTSRLVREGTVAATVGWKTIVVASLSNLVFKGGVVAAWGSRRTLRLVGLGWGLALAVGVALLVLWP